MSDPVFSIITPTFRRPHLLRRALLSIRGQTFGNYEHIIVDDAAQEESAKVVMSFEDPRIVYHSHEAPRGAGAAYNTGIRLSRGKFVLFLDDDDEYLSEFLDKMYRFFSSADPSVGFAWAGIAWISDTEAGEKEVRKIIWPAAFPHMQTGLMAATSIGNGFGVCIRRECIDAIGWFDESLICGQDTEFLFRLARSYPFGTIPEVLVKIHQHNCKQLTDTKNDLMRLEFRKQILQRHLDLLRKYPRLYQVHYKGVADYSYRLGLRKQGRKTVCSLIRINPFNLINYADLLCYELAGKDALACYKNSLIRRMLRISKRAL